MPYPAVKANGFFSGLDELLFALTTRFLLPFLTRGGPLYVQGPIRDASSKGDVEGAYLGPRLFQSFFR